MQADFVRGKGQDVLGLVSVQRLARQVVRPVSRCFRVKVAINQSMIRRRERCLWLARGGARIMLTRAVEKQAKAR